MLKTKLLLFTGLLLSITVNGQFGPQQIISSTTEKAYLSIPFDIDNDGFEDVVTAGREPYELNWHRNLDGLGDFGAARQISNTPALYLSLDFVDLDADGDNDLVYLENNPKRFGWFENLDGLGNFGTEQIILEEVGDFIMSVDVNDMDGDDDLDLILTRTNTFTDKITWYENLDGQGSFGQEIILFDNLIQLHSPVLADIDGDDTVDIVTSHENLGPAKLVWYKNLGNGNFDDAAEIHQFVFLHSDWTSIYDIQLADLNTDGRKDIAITAHHDDLGTSYHWFENLDNQGNFGPIQDLTKYSLFRDLDNDGDNDILAGNFFYSRIYWVENTDGLGNFSIERTISTAVIFLRDLDIADFNGDGLVDVVSASVLDDKIAWYENTGILNTPNNSVLQPTVYPNPTKDKISIWPYQQIDEITVFNQFGQRIPVIGNNNLIDLTSAKSGLYFLLASFQNGRSRTYKVIKE
ncbi:MAG: T9SS type A sorting domain-containing protein [Bacteroidota bacterium]